MNIKRMRGRNHRPGGGGGGGSGGGSPIRHHNGQIPLNRNHVFDSNGPDLRIRGTAQQLFEKYLQLGRDATSSGDRVMAEGYFQYAEHYFRIVNAIAQAAQQSQGYQQAPQPNFQGNNQQRGRIGDEQDGEERGTADPLITGNSQPPNQGYQDRQNGERRNNERFNQERQNYDRPNQERQSQERQGQDRQGQERQGQERQGQDRQNYERNYNNRRNEEQAFAERQASEEPLPQQPHVQPSYEPSTEREAGASQAPIDPAVSEQPSPEHRQPRAPRTRQPRGPRAADAPRPDDPQTRTELTDA